MIVLSAYYKGDVRATDRQAFDHYVQTVHLPLVAQWPYLKSLRLLKNNRQEYLGEMPQYYHCFELMYDNINDLAASLAAPQRERTREISVRDKPKFRELFCGDVLHMIYTVDTFPVIEPGEGKTLRCASYLGTVAPADRQKFDEYVRDVHLPDVAQWPRLRSLRLLKSLGHDFLGEKPAYYHTFELAFDSEEDMDFCMASEQRKETRRISAGDVSSFKGLFQGEVHHTNYAVVDIPVSTA
jgi:uncharacterized protein (TIGR02118 family)